MDSDIGIALLAAVVCDQLQQLQQQLEIFGQRQQQQLKVQAEMQLQLEELAKTAAKVLAAVPPEAAP